MKTADTKQRFANIAHVKDYSSELIDMSRQAGIMHQTLSKRDGKFITYNGKENLVEFLNCSYLGLDTHPDLIKGAQDLLGTWGIHMGNVRTRFSIEPQIELEEALGKHFGGHAITFSSVSTTHASVLPLIADGMALREGVKNPLLIFDKLAHSSMHCLKPIAAQYADVVTIENNDVEHLETLVKAATEKGQTSVYLTDSVFSMGGLPPMAKLRELSEAYDLYLYLDDAHGTSVFGEHGEGYVVESYGCIPEKTILIFSLAKAFGCNGGGVAFPSAEQKKWTQYYGQIYAFSSALPWGMIGAALASLKLHRDGTVKQLQQELKHNIQYFCNAMGIPQKPHMSPVQGIMVGKAETAISVGETLTENGFYAPAVFFPVVPKDKARIRVCLGAKHTEAQLDAFAKVLKSALEAHDLPLVAV